MEKTYLAVIASEAKQSMQPQRKNGLLRFARNDDLKRITCMRLSSLALPM
jgi:hypothetical protein